MKIKLTPGIPDRPLVGVLFVNSLGDGTIYYGKTWEGKYPCIGASDISSDLGEACYNTAVENALGNSVHLKDWHPIYEGDSVAITF